MTTRAVERPGVRDGYTALARAQKSGAGVPWYMRVVNRRLGRVIAAVAAPTRATPDLLTGASLLAFLAGAALLVAVEPSVPSAVAATLLLQLGFALDSADGQLARLDRKSTRLNSSHTPVSRMPSSA